MSILVVGVSHKTAPVELLEALALDADGVRKLVTDVASSEHVAEAAVIATCNRLEIYAGVDRFHGSVEELSTLLVDRADQPVEALLPHLYVHYDDRAVAHLFAVAAGLDSLAMGESQILGQARDALRGGQELGTVGPALNTLFQQALRVAKRAHSETDIDRAAPSLVQAALDLAVPGGDLSGRRVLVVGAGSMAGLTLATVTRRGATDLVVANRSAERAARLATEYAARTVPLGAVAEELQSADVVIACTGAAEAMITPTQLPARPIVLVDLALPHDIDPRVGELDGVTLVNLGHLAELLGGAEGVGRELDGVRAIVAEEVAAFLAARRQAGVTPTVVALRSMATGVVEAELDRLDGRLPTLDPAVRAELRDTVRRVADKLLHQPTVRVKELAAGGDNVSYATALADLFSLDPHAVEAVTRPEGLA